ncbi:3'-5' exonuclease [Cytobacillus firmus]|uniref:3'-5' exonuclease n=1 Tax=Cytobacillus firmus TaxID=1399 RepID=UPI0018CF18E3|nr:3'-5' exonuclease [Cytobacillus firmus]MBG9588774.1 exonuclease [Cytobacillus firmus]
MAELKQLVFFDFEMLCSKSGMLFEDMEAIRLGAVKVDVESGKVTGFDRFIRPQKNSPLSTFCKELTGISDSDLEKADDFPEVFKDFLFWVGGVKKARFFSWSSSDILRLKADASRHNLPQATIEKITKRYVDFQAIFTKRASRTAASVEKALSFYELSFIGEPHHPMYDAYNTLRIYESFEEHLVKTDLIMVQQFIFQEAELPPAERLSLEIKYIFQKDLVEFYSNLNDAFRLKDAWKLIKKTKKLVEKYENILLSRSGIFDKELIAGVEELLNFYKELQTAYREHCSYTSKIMILHEQMVEPLQKICV